MPEVKTELCSDCGSRLSQGVCPACALGFLTSGSGVPVVAAKSGEMETEFGSYVLKERIAAGGMGVVYRAEHRELRREVALKMIRGSSFATEPERARFMLEAEAAARLDHRNIVPIYEVGLVDGQPFFTMKLICGRSLAEHLKDSPPAGLVVGWLAKIARAVYHAHQHGVLHRDLKPGNVLIDEKGEPYLTDFGLAKLHRESGGGLTGSADRLGTPNYMSPENFRGAGEVSTTSDIWALGVILWEGIVGKPPFGGGDAVEIMHKITSEEPGKPGGDVDRDLLTLALRCIEKDPARRLQTAGEIAEELGRWERGEPLRVQRVTTVERLVKWVRRKPVWAALYLALAAGTITSLVQWRRAEQAVDSLLFSNEKLGLALSISDATRLAVESRVQVDGDPSLGLLLAVESARQTERVSGAVLPESANALFEILQQVGGGDASPGAIERRENANRTIYLNHGHSRDIVPEYSPDSRWMINIDHGGDRSDGIKAMLHPRSGEPGFHFTLWDDLGDDQKTCWFANSQAWLAIDGGGAVTRWTPDATGGSINFEKETLGTLVPAGDTMRRVCVQRHGEGIRGLVLHRHEGSGLVSSRRFRVRGVGAELEFEGEVRAQPELSSCRNPFKLSPDSRWVIYDHEGELRLGNFGEDGALEVATFPVPRIEHPLFDETCEWLAFRDNENLAVGAIDLRSGDVELAVGSKSSYPTCSGQAFNLAFSRGDGLRLLAYADLEDKVRVAKMEEEGVHATLHMNSGRVLGLNFSADGKRLAAASLDRVVRVWDVSQIGHSPLPLEFRGLPTAALAVYLSPDGKELLAEGQWSIFHRWDYNGQSSGVLPELLPGEQLPIKELAVSPDRRWIAVATEGELSEENSGLVKLIDRKGGGEHVLASHGWTATGVAFSPGGRWMASAGQDRNVYVWEMAEIARAVDLGEGLPLPVHTFDLFNVRDFYWKSLEFQSENRLFGTCGDGFLFDWNLRSEDPDEGREDFRIHSFKYQLPGIRISPDGRWLAVARHAWDHKPLAGWNQFSNMVLLFDVSRPGTPVRHAQLPARFLDVTDLDFTPDSRWLAAGGAGAGASVWDLHAEDIAASRRDSEGSAQSMPGIAFSPDSNWLAFGGSSGGIHLWDWRRGQGLRSISTKYPIDTLTWLEEGKLLSGGAHGFVKVWHTELDELKALARKAVSGRKMTDEERRRFRIP